jgi:hypothetical protein
MARFAPQGRRPTMATSRTDGMRGAGTATVTGRWIISAVAALCAMLVALPQQAAAANLVPFRATVAETFTAGPCPPMPSLCVTSTGSGQATHLGNVREATVTVLDLASKPGPGCATDGHAETRATTLFAANGDQITLVGTGYSCPTGPTTLTAVDSYVVTGGTGRFSGASGGGTIAGTIDLANGTAVDTFSGVLSEAGGHDIRRLGDG